MCVCERERGKRGCLPNEEETVHGESAVYDHLAEQVV